MSNPSMKIRKKKSEVINMSIVDNLCQYCPFSKPEYSNKS